MGGKTNRLLYVKPCELSMGEVGPEHMCAGAQAIMPAHKLGAGKMVMLGFDNKPGHWATSLRKLCLPAASDPEVFDAYAKQFAEIAKLPRRGKRHAGQRIRQLPARRAVHASLIQAFLSLATSRSSRSISCCSGLTWP